MGRSCTWTEFRSQVAPEWQAALIRDPVPVLMRVEDAAGVAMVVAAVGEEAAEVVAVEGGKSGTF